MIVAKIKKLKNKKKGVLIYWKVYVLLIFTFRIVNAGSGVIPLELWIIGQSELIS